jgi:pyrroloquinoline quinone (PQQ) biosynthesis protein C
VPKTSNPDYLQWMASYISEMVEVENKEFAKKLRKIIKEKNPYGNFVKALEEPEDGWIYGWNSWEGDNAFEEMKKWFIKLPFKIREEMDHFDDCPICQTMKEGKTSPKELQGAFRKANFKKILDDILNKDK